MTIKKKSFDSYFFPCGINQCYYVSGFFLISSFLTQCSEINKLFSCIYKEKECICDREVNPCYSWTFRWKRTSEWKKIFESAKVNIFDQSKDFNIIIFFIQTLYYSWNRDKINNCYLITNMAKVMSNREKS